MGINEGYANTPEVNTEKRKSPKTSAHADITEMKCLNGIPCSLSLFSACSLVWGVFTTKGLSMAMQLLDLHFLTMSR